jgi:hypothetical protein
MKNNVSRVLAVVCALSALPALAGDFTTCFGTKAGITESGLNDNLNDIGMMFHDAKNTSCNATTVAQRLRQKITAMNNAGAFSGFLAGGSMGLAMATTLELGGRVGTGLNQVSVAELELLDQAIYASGQAYQFQAGVVGDECGINFRPTQANPLPGGEEVWRRANSCMDDYAIGAWALGWKAAYYAKTSRPNAGMRTATINHIKSALGEAESICVHDPTAARDTSANKRGECNSNVGALSIYGPSELVSLNHGSQSPAYGIGLMTSISTAFTGLDVAGYPINVTNELTANEKKAAEYLLFEGRQKSVGGAFSSTACFNMQGGTTVFPWVYGTNADLVKPWKCSDNVFTYHADMFAVKEFYDRYGFSTSLSVTGHSYATANFNETHFKGNEVATPRTEFFGPGRRAVYRVLSGDWVYAAGRPSTGLQSRGEYKMNLSVSDWVAPYAHYLAATGGGGSTATSSDIWNDANARWYLVDLNKGDLNHGDAVALRSSNGYYLTAVNGGGGAVNATGTTPGNFQRFIILNREYPYGPARIEGSKRFALGTYDGAHYVSVNGTSVDATSTIVSDFYPSAQTFLFGNLE